MEIQRRLALLSPRQHEILDLILRGLFNKQIAAQLDIAERTVEDHRRHIMEKMQADSVAALVRMVTSVIADPPPPPSERRKASSTA